MGSPARHTPCSTPPAYSSAVTQHVPNSVISSGFRIQAALPNKPSTFITRQKRYLPKQVNTKNTCKPKAGGGRLPMGQSWLQLCSTNSSKVGVKGTELTLTQEMLVSHLT